MASNSPRVTKRDLPPPPAFDDGEAATRPDPSLFDYPSTDSTSPTPAAELEAVRQVSLSLTASLDLPTVLETILKVVFQLMKGAKNVHVFSYDSENDRLSFEAAVRADGRKAAPWPAPRLHGLTHTVARGGETVAVSDMNTHPLYADAPGHWGGAIVGLPLKIGQRVAGVMNVAYPRPHAFNESELATLRLLADQAALAIENARLYQVERRRAEQLVGLHEITQALGVITDSKESYGIMTRRLAELLGARLCLVLLYEPHKPELCARPSAYGIDDETLLTIGVPLQEAQRILELHRHEVFLANHRADRPELFDLLARHLKIESLLVASIGRMVGLIVVADKPGGFNDDDTRLVSIFSNQARALIENAELFAEMSETLSREKRLNDISHVIGGTLDLPSVLSNIVRLAAELVGADAGSLGLVSADGQFIHFAYLYNLPETILYPLPKGQGIAWHMIETGEPVLLNDYRSHPRAVQTLIETGVKTFLGVPVVAGEVRLGALGLFSLDSARAFGKRDLALVASIGRQAGVAIQNARLFEAEHRQVAALTALHETSLSLSAQLDLKVLLRNIVDRARQLLDAGTGALYLLDAESQTIELAVENDPASTFIGARLKLGEGLSGRVAQSGEPLYVEDYSTWPGRTNAYRTLSFRSLLGVPIKWQGQVMGVITVSDDRVSRFGPGDLELVGLFADQAAVAISNARLFAESQRQTQELSGLYKTALATGSVLETDVLLSRLHEQVQHLINPDTFGIVLYDSVSGELEIALAVENGERLNKMKVPISEGGLTGWIISNNRPLLIHDMQTDPLPVPARPVTQPARSWLGVPLIARDQTIGAVSVQSFQPRAFTEAHRRLLESLAGQVAISLENARLFEAEHAAREQSEALSEVARTLNSSLDREQVLQTILEQLARVVDYDSTSVALLTDNTLDIVASRGFRSEGQRLLPFRFDSSQHILKAIESRSPVVISDTTQDERWRHVPGAEYIRCWLGVPLLVKDRVIGLLNLDKEEPGFYTEQHARLAVAFATQAAVAIENARLYSDARNRATEIGQLYAAAQDIGASLDQKTVFEQLAKHFTHALDVTSCYVLEIDPESNVAVVLAEYWSEAAPEVERKSDLGRKYDLSDYKAVATAVAEQRIVSLVIEGDDLPAIEQAELIEYGAKSALIVPLVVRGQVAGLAEVWESRKPRLFTSAEIRLAQTLSRQAASVMENARLYQALARDKQRLELLYQLGQDLATRLDPEQVYTAIHRATAQLMPGEAFAIALLDEERQEVELVYAVDRGARAAVQRMAATDGLSGYVISRRQPMRVDDTNELKDVEMAQFGGPEPARSLLAVPLKVGDKVIGALTAQSYSPRAFTSEDQQTLETLTYQAAIAIENARLYDETQQRLRDQTLLYECGRALAQARDVHTAIASVVERVVHRLHATSMYFYTYDPVEDATRMSFEYWTEAAAELERRSALGETWQLSNYPRTAAALRTGAPQITRSNDSDLTPAERAMMMDWAGRTVLTVPVMVHDRTFGLFEVWDSRAERDFDEADKRLVMSLATQTAITLENARLLEETSQRAYHMALLNDITRVAVATADWRGLLQTLADRLGELFEADGCFITLWDETRQMTVPGAAYGDLSRHYPSMTIEPGEQTMTASVLKAGHALVAEDVFNSPHISPSIAAMFPTRSMLGLPLIVGNNKLGAALIAYDQPRRFTTDEIVLGEQIAGQIVLLIARAQLFDATRRSADELKIASDILRLLNASPQVVDVFPKIASNLKTLTGCERVSLALITEDRRKVIMAALDQPRTELSQGARFPLAATSAAPDILEGRLHLTADLAAEAAYPAEKALHEAGFRSRINLPLRVGDQVIGALNFVWPTLAGYTLVNLSLLEQIADAVALAIEKNRLFDETRRRDAILGALAYASEQLLKPGDLHDELPALLARLGQAAEVSRVYVFENQTGPGEALTAGQRYEWSAPGQASLQNIDDTTRWLETLRAGQSISGLVRDLPPAERAALESQGVLSVLIVPIFSGEVWWGYLGFDECTQERIWLAAEVEALKSAAGALGAAFARQRSEAAERRQRELTEALRDTAAVMSSTLNFDEVLERVLANVGRVAPHDAADIMLVNAAGTVRVVRCHGYAERGLEEWVLSLEFNLADIHNLNQMAETGQPHIISDAQQDPGWVDLPQSRWIRSYVGAPIVLKGRVIGFINLMSETPDFFASAQAEGLKSFADQVAVAIDNAQLYDEVSALYNASSQLINPGGDLRGLAEQIALSVAREFSFAHCGVLLIDETGVELRRVARTGLLQELAPSTLSMNDPGAPAVAARAGEIVYLPGIAADGGLRSELAVPLKAAGKIIGVLDLQSREPGIFDDRTRRIITAFAEHAALALENVRLVASLEMSRQVAEDANRLKSEFLANTSHELRTPLTGIIGSLSMVLDGLCDTPEEEREFARIAYTASQRLLTIINDVLDIAKIEAGRMDVRLQAVDLDALFKDVGSLSRVQAEEKKLTLEFALPETMEHILWADPDKLRQVLLNLIGNAIKFTDQGGVKVVAVVTDSDKGRKQVRLDVRDTGIGIPLDKQSKLFQPFVQVDGSMTRRFGGTGLGLSISRRLAELMGGRLDMSSPGEGLGSTFTVTLPAVSQAELGTR